jgi:hypothetical protein
LGRKANEENKMIITAAKTIKSFVFAPNRRCLKKLFVCFFSTAKLGWLAVNWRRDCRMPPSFFSFEKATCDLVLIVLSFPSTAPAMMGVAAFSSISSD